jgi:DNA adenine methylase
MVKPQKPVQPVRPFLKWAGGKRQLLNEFDKRLPADLKNGRITKYVEPFIGGGAFFIWLNQRFSFEECSICDANQELVIVYRVIQESVDELIDELDILQSAYRANTEIGRQELYYETRDAFNQNLPSINIGAYQSSWVERAAQIIFLNRTCFNGLFRVNRNGEFNVPFGKYKNPDILNKENLMKVAAILKNSRILYGDFTQCWGVVDDTTFIYLDPPYRPLNSSSSFTSYAKEGFSDEDQVRLAGFYRKLDSLGAYIMLSNSDPKNIDSHDTFFDDMYAGYTIERVTARRRINSNGARRGVINELVITNYSF